MYMPRFACRSIDEIVSIKLERLQDISEEDARKEGCKAADIVTGREVLDPRYGSYILHFKDLWDSINGKDDQKCWDANPWVWVIGFRRVE